MRRTMERDIELGKTEDVKDHTIWSKSQQLFQPTGRTSLEFETELCHGLSAASKPTIGMGKFRCDRHRQSSDFYHT